MGILDLHNCCEDAHMIQSTPCKLLQEVWYHVSITITGNNVYVSINDVYYFAGINMGDTLAYDNIALGISYYKVMYDNIYVDMI